MKPEFSISSLKASKRAYFFLAVVGGLLFSLSSCQDDEPPNYPVEPSIEFVSAEVTYDEEDKNGFILDVLKVTIKYQDGDGDVGAEGDYGQFPYHEATYFKREPPHDTILNIEDYHGELLQFGDKPGGLDTLPQYEGNSDYGIDCSNYTLVYWWEESEEYEMIYHVDTVYRQLNENFYNFFMEVYIKRGNVFEHQDFRTKYCIPLHGRFKREGNDDDSPFKVVENSRSEGTINFRYRIHSLSEYFGGDSIKLQIYIKDRNLNKSNVVESSVLYIQE